MLLYMWRLKRTLKNEVIKMARTLKVNGKTQTKLTEKTLSIVENLATLNPSSGDFVTATKFIDAIFPAKLDGKLVAVFQNDKKTVEFTLSTLRDISKIANNGSIKVSFVNPRGGSKDEAVISTVEI